tara:strand:- start:18 stop:770 length:753 start_codon:yes stop_codon:yes gene_type:complete
MSRLLVNNLRAYSGSVITIPSTTKLSLGGKTIGENSVLPSASGQTNKAVGSNGESIQYDTYGATNLQVFQSSGTYTKAAGVNQIMVRLVAAGGGGSGHAESGGAGGFSEKIINVSGISTVSVNIGTGGSGTYYSGRSGQGSSTSFGTFLSASGGDGANQTYQHAGGLGGIGSGGDVNMYGGGGAAHGRYNGAGGYSFFGGCAARGHPRGGDYSRNHQDRCAPGSGGANGWFRSYLGPQGKNGMVVVWEFK